MLCALAEAFGGLALRASGTYLLTRMFWRFWAEMNLERLGLCVDVSAEGDPRL